MRMSLTGLPGKTGRRLLRGALSFATFITASSVLFSTTDEKRISIYSPVANYSLAIAQRDGRDYVGVLEVLEPLGNVSAKAEGEKWKLRFNNHVEATFSSGRHQVRIHGHDLDLTGRFFMERGRGLVPVDSLVTLLPQFLNAPVVFHLTARRLFIKQVGTTFSLDLRKTAPPRLVLNFSAPVNPTIVTEPGKLHLTFVRDPLVVSASEAVNFTEKAISSATFQESNGAAEISVAGEVPLLARFSNNGRTITIVPAPGPGPATPAQAQVASQPAPNPAPALPAPPPAPAQAIAQPHHFLAVIDPSHGGTERGVAFNNQLLEKDVTLAYARRIRQELENRGISVLMTRDADTTLTLDQRASMTNTARPSLYINVHAGNQGSGVRVYTDLMPTGYENRAPFLPWDTAQSPFLSASQLAASALVAEIRKLLPVRTLTAPLRPLNNVTSAALALEIAPREADLADLTSADYQQLIAAAVGSGVSALRDRTGAAR